MASGENTPYEYTVAKSTSHSFSMSWVPSNAWQRPLRKFRSMDRSLFIAVRTGSRDPRDSSQLEFTRERWPVALASYCFDMGYHSDRLEPK